MYVLSVRPAREVVTATWEKSRFKETEEDSGDNESSQVVN